MEAWENPRRGEEARLSPWEAWMRWQRSFRASGRRWGRVSLRDARQAAADGLVELTPKDAWRAGVTPAAHARAVAYALRTEEEIEEARFEYYGRQKGTYRERYNEDLDVALPEVGIGPADVPSELREYGYRTPRAASAKPRWPGAHAPRERLKVAGPGVVNRLPRRHFRDGVGGALDFVGLPCVPLESPSVRGARLARLGGTAGLVAVDVLGAPGPVGVVPLDELPLDELEAARVGVVGGVAELVRENGDEVLFGERRDDWRDAHLAAVGAGAGEVPGRVVHVGVDDKSGTQNAAQPSAREDALELAEIRLRDDKGLVVGEPHVGPDAGLHYCCAPCCWRKRPSICTFGSLSRSAWWSRPSLTARLSWFCAQSGATISGG